MLGMSLVVGWYLTLPLAEKDGLPKETMANCYVVTALAAIAGSRVLYIVTNPDEFKSIWDLFALRNGGLVAYGGFIGGLLGSWAFLAPKKIRLLAWADDAVPSLASGLLITRIGCYLFGCDFGKRLPDGAPQWLRALGTFPHWAAGTLASGEGSPAYVRHLDVYRGTPMESDLIRMNTSFPVHPTQNLRVPGRPRPAPAPPVAAQVHEVPRTGVLSVRVRVRVPAFRPRAVAR